MLVLSIKLSRYDFDILFVLIHPFWCKNIFNTIFSSSFEQYTLHQSLESAKAKLKSSLGYLLFVFQWYIFPQFHFFPDYEEHPPKTRTQNSKPLTVLFQVLLQHFRLLHPSMLSPFSRKEDICRMLVQRFPLIFWVI